MSAYPPERIHAAARALLPSLNEALRSQVEALLAQAEGGGDTHLQLLTLLTQEDATRLQLRALLKDEETTLGFRDLAGDVEPTPGEIYVCPQPDCNYRYVIGEAGETPPPCPRHHQPLIRADEKKER